MTEPTMTPAPGDVMSEDVLKAISFLRNDAYGCAWIAGLIERLTADSGVGIAGLIERLTADSGVGMDELREHIAVLEKALRIIKAENDRAKREFTNVSNKVIELAIAATLADTGKDGGR